ncbi:MAG: M23 family metallopeptidase [Cytophagaceae bacterium]|nr:M23 family metallopeptidase [Cytophagaceae bacterium]
MKWKLNKFVFFILLFPTLFTFTQNSFSQNPQEKFTFPIKPGEQNFLSATMGELRANHFHGGYDVKTDKKTGYPVYSAMEGYVSRIKISSYGYGNAVYITHPNNYVTVYAHLDKFNTPIGDYARKKQYELQSFDIDIYPGKNDLPVKKGEVIALAGNSGSSQGPHLHYEIRDTNDIVLNPSDFGFKEIHDKVPPVFDKIAVTTLDINARVNDEFGRQEYKVTHSGNVFSIPAKITASGLIGLELQAYDKKNDISNHYGINYIKVLVDDKEIFVHNLSRFSFDETRYINAHIDYPYYYSTGKRFERLYVADGNKLNTYTYSDPLKGRFYIQPGKTSKVKIIIKDDFNIESSLTFNIHPSPAKANDVAISSFANSTLTSEILENTLKLTTECTEDPGAELYFKGSSQKISASYAKGGIITYLYDLRKGLPDSVKIGSQKKVFSFIQTVPGSSNEKINFSNISMDFFTGSITDTIYLEYKKEVKNSTPVYTIHNPEVSIYDSIRIGIKPTEPIGDKNKSFVYLFNGSSPKFEGGKWNGDIIEFKTRNLGKFAILEDTTRPAVRFLSNYGNSARFIISDDLSGIESFRGTLDGYWVLLNYDHKWNVIWTERLDKTVPLKGNFVLEVKDKAGNINTFTIQL